MRDLAAVKRTEKSRAMQNLVKRELAALEAAGARLPMRTFDEVERFVPLFAPTAPAQWRRPLFVIVGSTGVGKSMLAADMLLRIARLLGVSTFTEVTVEDDAHMDVSDYNADTDAGILLDGIGDMKFLHTHREALQGRPKMSKGARSATMRYSYPFTLARRAVVATLDLSARNLHWLTTHHWLSDRKNVIYLRLSGPAWQEDAQHVPPQIQETPRSTMSAWSVDDVALWLEAADASGLAHTLRSNDVNGQDVVAFVDESELVTQLRLTPFSARKLLQLRNKFLSP